MDSLKDSGLLAELERAAAETKAKLSEETEKQAEATRQTSAALVERLREAYAYFAKLKENLEVLQPDCTRSFTIPGLGKLENLRQSGYLLHSPEPVEKTTEFTFQVMYGDPSDVQQIRLADRGAAKQFKDLLWNYKLRFKSKDVASGETVFALAAAVPINFEFSVDVARGRLRFTTRNLEALGPATNHFSLEAMNGELMEEIAKCVLQKPNRLAELTGDNLSKTGLNRIRDAVRQAREAREVELDQPEPEPQTVEEPSHTSTIRRLGSLLKR
ncbi:MAG: hypothetical protein AAF493_14240 [Pseudomonadota bacterium]